MNPRTFTACGIAACILAASASYANQYTITIVTGYNLIANELDHVDDLGQPDGNTLSHIMGSDNTLGCCLMKYDNPTAQWLIAVHTAAGWSPDLTLDPGEGAFLANPNPPFDLTFTGNPIIPILPLPGAPSGLYSCQDETIDSANYTQVTGDAPVNGNTVALWNGADYTVYTYHVPHGPGWYPSTPAVPRGQAAWFNFAGLQIIPPTYLFSSFTLEPSGGSLTLVWVTGMLQQSSDLVTWTDVLDVNNQPVTSPYTTPIGPGCLYFRLRS